MRSFIYALLISIVLAVGSIWYTCRLTSISGQLAMAAEQITDELKGEDFSAAAGLTRELGNEFLRLEPFFSTFGDHEETDAIERCIAY